MTDKDHPPSELPLPCVLDDDDIDRLLERLRAVHGEPRQDIAPGLNRQGRARKAAEVIRSAKPRPRSMAANFAKLPELWVPPRLRPDAA